MLTMPISCSKTLIVWRLSYLKAIILSHSHSFCCPQMSRKPLNFATTHFIWHNKHSSFSNMFTTLWQFLHSLWFSKFFFHILSHPSRNTISIMAHSSSSDRSGKSLMSFFLGIKFQISEKLSNFCRSLLNKFIKVDMP